jgi:valine--pyruvate aminotransferase
LFNLLAGEFDDGSQRRVLLPLTPEYVGYADLGLGENLFISQKPVIEHLDDRLFKYHVDFDALRVEDDVAAICVSRPTNPTGNVLTDAEVTRLAALAREHEVPLILDNAYGVPFPGIVFDEVTPFWDENIILCMSLSKVGLPAARTGIVVATERVIDGLTGMNSVFSLAVGSVGAVLMREFVETGEIIRLSQEVIKPFYEKRARHALSWMHAALDGCEYHIHKPEGAFFLWLWLPELPVTSAELYERLKARGVFVIPGHHFFPGLAEDWPHRDQCIRVSYSQDENAVREGIRIIGEEVKRATA